MGSISIRGLIKKYAVAFLFPIVSGYLIYADYSRTQRWKAKLAAESETKI